MRGGEGGQALQARGHLVTLRDLIDELAATLCGFSSLAQVRHEFTFDVDLARAQSEENPVYYVQYAHARVCSVLEKAGISH